MIVDDNLGTRALIRELLAGKDVEIVECDDGTDAVQRYAAEMPDCVVMDLAMKLMDGLTATRLIKSRFSQARIVIMTQFSDPKLRECAMDAGASQFLHKENLIQLPELALGTKGQP
jgi:CheY-like chemotaxis protein